MHGLRRIVLLALILGGLLSFAGLRSSIQPARADNVASFFCDTGNPSFQVCTVTLNVGAGGSFSAALVLGGGQILSCGSIPAGVACSHTSTQAVFACLGGCAAGSRYQIIVSGPSGSASQMAFSIGPGGALVAAPAYTTSYGAGYAPYAGYSSCYGFVLVGCAGASSYSYSSCGLYLSYYCSSPFVNGCVT
ncbi:MAG TPA: hypothetical protein VK821_10050, partial [Dehalococcoidia bacterium]|nr:hypothetical protein [Dehalococcoidia bacterium]